MFAALSFIHTDLIVNLIPGRRRRTVLVSFAAMASVRRAVEEFSGAQFDPDECNVFFASELSFPFRDCFVQMSASSALEMPP